MTDRTASMRQLLVRLTKGAQLQRAGGAFVLSGRRGPKACIPSELVDLLVGERLVAETAGGIAITAAGEHWLAGDASLALEARLVTDEGGREHYVVVNTAESPLSLLRRHGAIGAAACDAGEKLRRDYTIGQLTPRMGVDYSALVGSHAFRPDLTETVVAARQRFNAALKAAGPGLADVLFDVCCYLMRPEDCERSHNWPRGSGRVVLSLALDRLAEHYGMTAPSKARTRSWRKD
jgi:hypothetical protein